MALQWTREFPILRHCHYLNHAACSPMSFRGAREMRRYALSSTRQGQTESNWKVRIEETHSGIKSFLGAGSDAMVGFSGNTTSALRFFILAFPWEAGDELILAERSHPAIFDSFLLLESRGVNIVTVPYDSEGRLTCERILSLVTQRTKVVALPHVHPFIGFRMDLKGLSQSLRERGIFLVVDCIQSLGSVPLNVKEEGIDFLACDGRKWLLGLESCGFFYVSERLSPFLKLDPSQGAPNVPGVLALGAGMKLLSEVGLAEVWKRIDSHNLSLRDKLGGHGFRFVSSARDGERSGILSFQFPNLPSEVAVEKLKERKLHLSARTGFVRVSPHFYNGEEQIEFLADSLLELNDLR